MAVVRKSSVRQARTPALVAAHEKGAAFGPQRGIPYSALLPMLPEPNAVVEERLVARMLVAHSAHWTTIVAAKPDPRIADYKQEERLSRARHIDSFGSVVIGEASGLFLDWTAVLWRWHPNGSTTQHYLLGADGKPVEFKGVQDAMAAIDQVALSPWGWRWGPALCVTEYDGLWTLRPGFDPGACACFTNARGQKFEVTVGPAGVTASRDGQPLRDAAGNPIQLPSLDDARRHVEGL